MQSGVSQPDSDHARLHRKLPARLLSGGIASVSYSDHYLSENAPSDVLNPSVAPSVSVSVQQNLLRGFGSGRQRPHHHGGPDESEHHRAQFQDAGDLRGQPGPECTITTWRRITKTCGRSAARRKPRKHSERREAADRNRIGGAHRLDRRRGAGGLQRAGCGGFRHCRCGSRN